MSINLGNGCFATVDCIDYELVAGYSWYGKNGYAASTVKVYGKRVHIYMHSLILPAVDGKLVDHVDGDRSNNRRANLRYADAYQNAWNARSSKKRALPRGVSKVDGGYTARITVRGVDNYLGFFASPDDAGAAYREASIRFHKDFSPMATS